MERPKKVLVRPRINENRAREAMALGFLLQQRSTHQEQALTEKRVASAAAIGRDGLRGNRTDAVGNRQADDGKTVTGWSPEGRQNVSLSMALDDVMDAGYHLADVHLVKKEGDRMYFLYLDFNESGKLFLTKEQWAFLDAILGKVYGHVHAFRNPDGSTTINPAHMQGEDQVAQLKVNDLRFNTDGSLRCVPR